MENSLFSPSEISGKSLLDRYPWMKDHKFICVKDPLEVKRIVDEAIKAGVCAVDTETSGLDTRVYDGKCNLFIAGICLSYDGITGYYIPVNHGENDEGKFVRNASLCVDLELIREDIQRLLDNCVCVYHNSIYDHDVLEGSGFKIPEFANPPTQFPVKLGKKNINVRKLAWEDTWCLAYLWNNSLKRKGLKVLSETLLQKEMIELKDLFPGKQQIMFYLLDPNSEECTAYAASDAICTFLLYKFFEKEKVKQDQAFIYYIELRCAVSTRQMYHEMTRLDIPKIKEYKSRLLSTLKQIENDAVSLLGRDINLSSPQQVAEALVNDFGIDVTVKNEQGQVEKSEKGKIKYETGEEILEPYAKDYPFAALVLEHRGIIKTIGTYLDNLISNADRNNEVRFKFQQWSVETGRFSCSGGGDGDGFSGINVQAVTKPPKAKDLIDKDGNMMSFDQIVRKMGSGWFLRSCFIPRPGCKIVAIDYSGQELRVAANLSNEPVWVQEFLEGDGDLHTQSAKIVFKTDEPTADMRDKCKTANFQTAYGGGATALSGKLGISVEAARDFQQKLLGALKTLKSWMDKTKKTAHKTKYAETPLGRRRPLLPAIESIDRAEVAKAERIAINTPVQGTGGDMMKLAMALCRDYIAKYPHGEVRILFTVHDELVFEIQEDKLDFHIPNLMNIMCLDTILHKGLDWKVPLSMDCEIGNSWDVEYEYFKKKPEALGLLTETLRFAKCRAMKYDPVTLKPKGEKAAPAPKNSVTVKEAEMTIIPAPKEPILNLSKTLASDDGVDGESSVVQTLAQDDMEGLTVENSHAIPVTPVERKPVSISPNELEVINSENFDTVALDKAIEAFLVASDDKSSYLFKEMGLDIQKAFLIGLSVYVRTVKNQIVPNIEKLTGREILQSTKKYPESYLPYCYKLKGGYDSIKREQIKFLLKFCCDGITNYEIVSHSGELIEKGEGLNPFMFQVLAEYHNL